MDILFLLAICIAVLIFIAYFHSKYRDDFQIKRIAKSNHHKSSGGFDRSARQALNDLAELKNPTADDNFRIGEILEHNHLEGDLTRAPTGQVLAIAGRYARSLDQILQDDDQGDEFMINRMIDFEDRVINQHPEIFAQRPMRVLADMILAADNKITVDNIQERKSLAEEEKDKATAIGTFLSTGVKYTDDRQSVHNPSVNKDLLATYTKISKPAAGTRFNPTKREIEEFFASKYSSKNAENARRISKILDLAGGNNIITALGGVGEADVIVSVWERAKDPKNSKVKNLMMEALIDSLIDCYDGIPASPVCINGRCGRYLSSLATLDHDESVGMAKTDEAYKNEILINAGRILNHLIDQESKSPDEGRKLVAMSYKDPSIEISEENENEFKNKLRARLNDMMNNYKDKLRPDQMIKIHEEMNIGFDLGPESPKNTDADGAPTSVEILRETFEN